MQYIINDVLNTVEEILESHTNDCESCGEWHDLVAMFAVTLSSGERLVANELFFDNMVDPYSISENFLKKIIEYYVDVEYIDVEFCCSNCLSFMYY